MYDFEAKPDAMNSVTPIPALKAPTPRKNHFSAGFAWISDNSLLQITNKTTITLDWFLFCLTKISNFIFFYRHLLERQGCQLSLIMLPTAFSNPVRLVNMTNMTDIQTRCRVSKSARAVKVLSSSLVTLSRPWSLVEAIKKVNVNKSLTLWRLLFKSLGYYILLGWLTWPRVEYPPCSHFLLLHVSASAITTWFQGYGTGLRTPFCMSGEGSVQKKISFVCGVTTEGEVLQERERPYDFTGIKCAIWTLHILGWRGITHNTSTISSPLLFDCATSPSCAKASALMCFLNRRIRQLQAIFTPATATYIPEFRKHCWISISQLQKSYGWVAGLMSKTLY